MAESLLHHVRVVLYEPQDPVNIAATIRAMKNMGVAALHLVRPAPFDATMIERVAHGTRDLVSGVRQHDTLEEALADCARVAAFTARRRAAKRVVVEPRAAAAELLAYAREAPVALLFGREDAGLPNDAIDLAHLVVTIPTTGHASLNLAQAALLAMYELHLADAAATRDLPPPRKDAPPARVAELERFYEDARRTLGALDFFRTRNPDLIMRTVRSLTSRAAPDEREVGLLRAIAIEVVRTIDRVGRGVTPTDERDG